MSTCSLECRTDSPEPVAYDMGNLLKSSSPSSSLPTIESNNDSHARNLTWTDIAQDFPQWCAELNSGELMAPDSFTLYDAMSAIELMDPKMDIGTTLKNREVKSFDHGAQSGKLKLANFSSGEILLIVDKSLSFFLLWTQGHCLAQTVFTLVYLHKPYDVRDEIVSTFCMALLELLDLVRQIMVDGGVVEEEDFQLSTSYLPSMNDPKIVRGSAVTKLLKSAEELANKNARKSKNLLNSEAENWNGILLRLKFLRNLIGFLTAFRNKCDNFFVEAPSQIQLLENLLEKISKIDYLQDDVVLHGFEPLINVHLLPPSFPRHTPTTTKEGPFSGFKELLKDFSNALNLRNSTKNMEQLLGFLRSTSGMKSRALTRSMIQIILDGIFGLRSACSGQAENVWLMQSYAEFIADSIRQFSNAPMLIPNFAPIENEESVQEYVGSFLKSCRAIFAVVVRCYGFNRARQRDALASCLADFYTLQDDAEKLDEIFGQLLEEMKLPGFNHAFCFGSWTLTMMLNVMEDYLISGLELELYADGELHFIYWYLHDVLYHCEMQTIIRADAAARENENAINAYLENDKRKNGRKKFTNHKSENNSHKSNNANHRVYFARAQSLHQICGAYHSLLLGLQWQGKLKRSGESLDCEEFRYYHRLMPFMERNAPAFVDYEQYQMVQTVIARNKLLSGEREVDIESVKDAYGKASTGFVQAEQFLPAWAKDQLVNNSYNGICNDNQFVENFFGGFQRQDLTKVCKRNDVIVKILSTGRPCKGVELVFDTHPWFPTLRLL